MVVLLTAAELELELELVVAAELRKVLELERTELVPALELELELERTELVPALERVVAAELRVLELLLRVTCCAPERVPVLELELRTAPELALERVVLALERVAEELELLLVFCCEEDPALERV